MPSTRNIIFLISLVMPVILVGLSVWQLVEPSVLHYQKCASAGAPMDYCTYDRGNLVTCIFETERNINASKCLACEVTSLLSAAIVLLSFFLGFTWLLIRFKKNSWVAHLGQAVANIICSLIIIGLQTYLSIIWENEYENPPSVPEIWPLSASTGVGWAYVPYKMPRKWPRVLPILIFTSTALNVRLTLTKGPGFYSSYGLLSAAGLMLILNIVLLDLSLSKRRGFSGQWLHTSTF